MAAPGETDPSGTPAKVAADDRWALVWDVLVFQIKLSLDALRDLVMSPLSLGALLLGLVAGGARPSRYFEAVLRVGRRSEHVINLFGSRRVPYDPYTQSDDAIAVDRLFGHVEDAVRRNLDSSDKASAVLDRADAALDELEARLARLRAEAARRFGRHGPGQDGSGRHGPGRGSDTA